MKSLPSKIVWRLAARIGLLTAFSFIVGYFTNSRFACITLSLGLFLLLISAVQFRYHILSWLEDYVPINHFAQDANWQGVCTRLQHLYNAQQKEIKQLGQSLLYLQRTIDVLPDAVVLLDQDHCLKWCNQTADRLLQITLKNDLGRSISNLVRDPVFVEYIQTNKATPLQMVLNNKTLSLRLIPTENQHQMLLIQDITQETQIETIRRDFVANASHELRTPLTVINGFLEHALEAPNLDPQQRQQQLKLMREQGQRMQNLLNDMLTLARLEADDKTAIEEIILMDELLPVLYQEAQALSKNQHHIELENKASIGLLANREEIYTAMSNLISNAVRYTPVGGKITLRWFANADGEACFAVSDTGIGIDREYLPRLTERFFRVDKSRSRATHGTGLGLSIVKHVLMRYEAQLHIESEIGKGTTFTITFNSKRLIALNN